MDEQGVCGTIDCMSAVEIYEAVSGERMQCSVHKASVLKPERCLGTHREREREKSIV